MDEAASGLEFPCAYPVKVMIEKTAAARREVLAVAAAHAPFSLSGDVRYRPSRNDRYESITITVQVESRSQLEGLYGALRALKVVKMTL
ncbi:MAG: YbeD family protein [Wenzhouxiangella sp.]